MKRIILAAALLLAAAGCGWAAGEELVIGILSWTGPFAAKKEWTATGEYLAEKLGRSVVIMPLDYKGVLPAAESGSVAFFTADPSLFVAANAKFGATAVLTMKNAVIGTDRFGAVIFTAKGNKEISKLADLKGKKFGALRRWSFAGWQMAEKEFRDANIDPYTFVQTLRFFEMPQAVIKAVLSRQVDAGTVPTGLLEQAAAAGEISMRNITVLDEKVYPDFPFRCSTALYPGFVLAKTAAADQQLADQVAAALKALPPDSKALQNAGLAGWIDPLDYSGIGVLIGQLKGGGIAGK